MRRKIQGEAIETVRGKRTKIMTIKRKKKKTEERKGGRREG
jgi:hypothetical protein